MEFRILGPLEVRDGDRVVRIRGRKQRALLALLLVNANRTLAIDRIVDELWGTEVPETAQKMVQIYVSQLRKLLPEGVLRTRPPGYALDVAREQLDLHRFEDLVANGRAALAVGDPELAAERLAQADAIWRGPALAEFASEPFARPEGARLEELRLAALEERLDADLARGRDADLVGELELLVSRHPLREGLRRRQMLALYRTGRQADALAAYQEARRALADELGLEPSPELRELQRRILEQDPELSPAAVAAPRPAPRSPVRPSAVGVACARCGSELPSDARFCPTCGAPAGSAPGAEMRKLATMLFADVVDSTVHGARLDPEDARELMAGFFDAMAAEIRAEGGTIEKFVGDAIMAVFGVPTAHEDDPLRAARAARRMVARLADWNAAREPAAPLEVRIGIDTGEVLAAGSPGHELLVTGDAVNMAARLQHAAEPGTILVGERTASALAARFELRSLEPLAVRGKPEPVEAWLLGHEREDVEERGGLAPAPIVGREPQLELLATVFAAVRDEGTPQLVTVVGDAGVGKSRLSREFAASLDGQARVVVGRCLPYGEGVTLWPLAEVLKGEAAVLENDSPSVADEKIRELVDQVVPRALAPDPEQTAAALASTLGHTAEGADPHENYRALLAAWRALVTALATTQPLVVVVEDLHWADQLMLDVLDDLAEHVEGPVVFLCTARPDLFRTRPGWGGARRRFASLPLDPLTADESAELVSLLLDVEELPADVKARILATAEGNPFFLEEIVRRLVDERLLVQEDGRWRARAEIASIEIPDTVQAVILARIDLLAPAEKRVLQQAAVVGRVFWSGAVARLGAADGLDEILRTLSRRELVDERLTSAFAGEVEYLFKHVLIRDVAYESLPRRERASAHAAAAGWIEEVSGERAPELAEFLAHHYDAAFRLTGDGEHRRLARTHALVAAENANRRLAGAQARRFAQRAVELSDPGGERAEALERLGDVAFTYYDGDTAWASYRAALADAGADREAVARFAAKAATIGTRWVGSMSGYPEPGELDALVAQGLAAAGGADGRDRSLLLSARGFSFIQDRAGLTDEAHAAAREAVEIAERLGDPQLLSSALDTQGGIYLRSGRYSEAWPIARQRLLLVPKLTDTTEIGDAHVVAGWIAFRLGLYPEALEHATAGIERCRGVDPVTHMHGLTWRVLARFTTGDWEGALEDQAELERLATEDRRELPVAATRRAYAAATLCHELRGDREEADRYFEIARRLAREPSRMGRRNSLGPAFRALVHRGLVDEARALFAYDPDTEASGMALEAQCDIEAAAGDWAGARETVGTARALAEETGVRALPFFADRLEGQIAAAEDERERAATSYRRAADGFAGLGAVWEEAYTRLLLGELTAERDQLGRALAVFERLGSVVEVERARSALSARA